MNVPRDAVVHVMSPGTGPCQARVGASPVAAPSHTGVARGGARQEASSAGFRILNGVGACAEVAHKLVCGLLALELKMRGKGADGG
jgi:hypothetical protein